MKEILLEILKLISPGLILLAIVLLSWFRRTRAVYLDDAHWQVRRRMYRAGKLWLFVRFCAEGK